MEEEAKQWVGTVCVQNVCGGTGGGLQNEEFHAYARERERQTQKDTGTPARE